MKIIFLSNFFSHHQMPFSEAMDRLTDGEYLFVETARMPEERKKLGYQDAARPAYLCRLEEIGEEAALQLVLEADALILGSAPERFLQSRLRLDKLCFRYQERPLKRGSEPLKYLPRLVKWRRLNPMCRPLYMLCASAYTAADYRRFGLFCGRCFRWGYFPPAIRSGSAEELIAAKQPGSILWCGRFLDWKHPDDAIRLASAMKAAGRDFHLQMIGTGPMEDELLRMIREEDLADRVELLGSMPPERVRTHMDRARIFLMTSDRQEGWGAVLNEAMNSGCAVVASKEAGSVPYLLRHGENGLVYENNEFSALLNCTERLLEDDALADKLGRNARRTVLDVWNGDVAAERFLTLVSALEKGENARDLFLEGPCSPDQGEDGKKQRIFTPTVRIGKV